MEDKVYIAIDLKSFYASVECADRGLDPLNTNLVVADESRTEKTICLAVSPSLKAFKIPGRARLFEVVQKVKEVNEERKARAPGHKLVNSSVFESELLKYPYLAVDYIVAKPRMARYMEKSREIFSIYLKHVSYEDIHVYSIDEVFIDATGYLKTYSLTPHEFAMKLVGDVLRATGITATAGIGTNLYLAKIAMDIMAKKKPADKDGVRVAELDEASYRKELWSHRPITDFWRVGKGYEKRLSQHGLYTMGDIARCSLGTEENYYNEELLYREFGINAELLIDHAWGYEPCTIKDIKAYTPENNSVSSGQVLQSPYDQEKGKLIILEMTDLLVLDLVEKNLVTDQLVIDIGYDICNLSDNKLIDKYKGEIKKDHYGRLAPKSAHGSINLGGFSSSTKLIMDKVGELYDSIALKDLFIRRLNVTANHVKDAKDIKAGDNFEQMDLFTDYVTVNEEKMKEVRALDKEKKMQRAILEIKNKYGKNALLRGMNFEEGATARDRNAQIGGHKA
ncbi:MAG: DNA methylase [Lachnospiraceae bacterium]|nr:DNA methylase [Lachnospiraceae bacterium]